MSIRDKARPDGSKTATKGPERIAPTTGVDKFKEEIWIGATAAIGVTIVRTREPFDVRQALEELCLAEKIPLRAWNSIKGWQTVDTNDPRLPVTGSDQSTIDVMPALMKLHASAQPDAQSTAANNMPHRGFFTMMWPDPYIKAIPQLRALLAELSNDLSFNHQRLFLIAPHGFECPDELAELIPIVDFDLPTQAELQEIYDEQRASAEGPQKQISVNFTEEEVQAIVAAGAGMTRREFANAVCVAYAGMLNRGQTGPEIFKKEIMHRKTDVVKRSEVLEVLKPVDMADVGGLDNLKGWVEKRRACFTEDAKDHGVDAPKGIALVGPPGTGKSLAAKAMGAVLQVPVIKFDLSRVFGSLVGESEARVSKALKMIDAMAPCVCMVDEVDKVFDTRSGSGDSGTSTRVLGKVLTHMQESTKAIFWVLTANRTQGLPPELLRKGRVDEIFSVTTPSESERQEIFAIHLRLRGVDISDIGDKAAIQMVIDASSDYVGAELEAAVKDAKVEAYHDGKDVTAEYIVAALKSMKPLSSSFKEDFDAMEAWAKDHARPSSSIVRVGRTRTSTGKASRTVGGMGGSNTDMEG